MSKITVRDVAVALSEAFNAGYDAFRVNPGISCEDAWKIWKQKVIEEAGKDE